MELPISSGAASVIIIKSDDSCETLSSESLELFYLSREAVDACMAEDFGILKLREIAKDVIEILEKFLSHEYKIEETNYILELHKKSKSKINSLNVVNDGLYEKLLVIDSDSVRMLRIDNTINLKTLKKCYNTASKKYHPDVGGSKEQMQKVNEAYSLFHEVISNFNAKKMENGKLGSEYSPEIWNEWEFSCTLLLSCLYADFFAADRAFQFLKTSFDHSKKSRPQYVGAFVETLLNSHGLLRKICGVLGRFEMIDELKEAAEITSSFIDTVVEQWGRENILYDIGRNYYPSKSSFEAEYGTKIVLTTLEQAKNAFRLGKIDEKRYKAAGKKFAEKNEVCIENVQLIENFYKQSPLIRSPELLNFDISLLNPTVNTPLGFYQNRFAHLKDDQKHSYIKSFYEKIDGEKCIQLLVVRANEILIGLINNFEKENTISNENEINFLIKNVDKAKKHFTPLRLFFQYLKNLSILERREKLNLLASIDNPEQESHTTILTFSLTSAVPKDGYKMRIESTNEYIEFAMMPSEFIKNFIITGLNKSGSREAWNNNLKILDKFQNSKISKNREKIWLDSKSPTPEMVIDSSIPYIEGLLEIGKLFHEKNTGELQIGYEINRLTTAYAKIKNWVKVKFWCEMFFNLPHNYRDRSPVGEQIKIRNRFDNAVKNLKNNKTE